MGGPHVRPGEVARVAARSNNRPRSGSTQREALCKILHGESTAPRQRISSANSTMSTVLDTLYAPIELSIDVDQRVASVTIEGLVSPT